MSNSTIPFARVLFVTKLEALKQDFDTKCRKQIKTIDFPHAFETNVERNLRVAAFEAVVEAVAEAERTTDLVKIQAIIDEAGIKYVPGTVEVHDGARWVETPTAFLV